MSVSFPFWEMSQLGHVTWSIDTYLTVCNISKYQTRRYVFVFEWLVPGRNRARIRHASQWPSQAGKENVENTHLRPCYQLVLFVDAHQCLVDTVHLSAQSFTS